MFSNVEYTEDGVMIIKEYPCRCPLMGIPLIYIDRKHRETSRKQPLGAINLNRYISCVFTPVMEVKI